MLSHSTTETHRQSWNKACSFSSSSSASRLPHRKNGLFAQGWKICRSHKHRWEEHLWALLSCRGLKLSKLTPMDSSPVTAAHWGFQGCVSSMIGWLLIKNCRLSSSVALPEGPQSNGSSLIRLNTKPASIGLWAGHEILKFQHAKLTAALHTAVGFS